VNSHAIVELRGVSHSFGATKVLEPTDLDIAAGSFVSLVGPSGCGKSTLFNAIAGLVRPSHGSIAIAGDDVTGSPGHAGYMLQKDLLVPWRTVLGNITLGASLRGIRDDELLNRARQMAHDYGLGDFLSHYPRALSGGMRQRVAFMRTLATEHDVVLLDEPFGALDAQTRFAMQTWITEVWRDTGRTIVFITHDVDEALFLSDRVIVFSPRPGRIVDDIEVAIDRPRSVSTLTTPRFMELKQRILATLHQPESDR
jgi:ABC-type nitrate/sulfonate/bicarbonate transport system ATPase subunit